MDELKKRRLKNQVIEQLKKQSKYHDAFEDTINVYVDMLLQKEIMEQRKLEHTGPGKNILLEVLQNLNEDIAAHKESLGIGV